MGSFGDKLRREREMRGITLEEISESTKISRRHLESLEKEDFGSLPGGVFNKGFVRSYARFLGIDEDQAAADYAAIAQETPPLEDKFPLEVHEKPNRELNPKNSNLPLILALAALLGVMIGYAVWFRNKKPQTVASASASAAANITGSQTGDTSPGPTSYARQTASRKPPAPISANGSLTGSSRQSESTDAEARSKAEHKFTILIQAKEDAWISVIADGRTITQGVLAQDRRKLVRAGKQIVLRTGNAGGIEVSYNGKPLGALGNESETRTMLFTSAGLTQ
jgi:cytoskeleton protein RodZ